MNNPATCCIETREIANLIIHYSDLGRYGLGITSSSWQNYIESYDKLNPLSIETQCGIQVFGGYRKFIAAYLMFVCGFSSNIFFASQFDPSISHCYDENYVTGILCSKLDVTKKLAILKEVVPNMEFDKLSGWLSLLLNISTNEIIDLFSLFEKPFMVRYYSRRKDPHKIILATGFLNNTATKGLVLAKLAIISTNIRTFSSNELAITLIKLGKRVDLELWLKISKINMSGLNECLAAAIKYEQYDCFICLLTKNIDSSDLKMCLSGAIIEYIGDGNPYKKYSYLPSLILRCNNIQIVQRYLERDLNSVGDVMHIHYLNLCVRQGCIEKLDNYKDFDAKGGIIDQFPTAKHHKMFIKLLTLLKESCIPIYNYECLTYLLNNEMVNNNYFYVTPDSSDCIKILNELFRVDNKILTTKQFINNTINSAIEGNNIELMHLLSRDFEIINVQYELYHIRPSVPYFKLLIDLCIPSNKLQYILAQTYPWYRLQNNKMNTYFEILNIIKTQPNYVDLFILLIVDLIKKTQYNEKTGIPRLIKILTTFYADIPKNTIIELFEKVLFIENLSFDSFVIFTKFIMNIDATLLIHLVSSATVAGMVNFVEYLLIIYPFGQTVCEDIIFNVLSRLLEISSGEAIRIPENYFKAKLKIKEIVYCLQHLCESRPIRLLRELKNAFGLTKTSLIKLCEYFYNNFGLIQQYRHEVYRDIITPSWVNSYEILKDEFKQNIGLLKRTRLVSNIYRQDQAVIYIERENPMVNNEADCTIAELENHVIYGDDDEELCENFLDKYYIDKNKRSKRHHYRFINKKVAPSVLRFEC